MPERITHRGYGPVQTADRGSTAIPSPDRIVQSVKRVFVTGGTGFLGYRVIRALLDEGTDVTVLVQPGGEEKLGALRGRIQWVPGDVWNPGSLRGRARNHNVAIHLVGGVKPDPARGLTFRHLNFVSARNVAQMAVSDGVAHFILLSASNPLFGIGGATGYLESKREAESYLQKSGLTWTIVRAPPLYAPGEGRNPAFLLISVLSHIPLLGLPFSPQAPLAVDTAARGIASLALSSDSSHDRLIQPRQLRRLGRSMERRLMPIPDPTDSSDEEPGLDEPPFGWLPPPSV